MFHFFPGPFSTLKSVGIQKIDLYEFFFFHLAPKYFVLMKEIIEALDFYSDEWKQLVEELNVFVPKCKVFGFCGEERSCNKNIPHSAAERDALISTALTLRNLSNGDAGACLL